MCHPPEGLVRVEDQGGRQFGLTVTDFGPCPELVFTSPESTLVSASSSNALLSFPKLGARKPAKRKAMREIKEVLRLKFEAGLASRALLRPRGCRRGRWLSMRT
jgi:hypothetical protein